MPIREQFKTVEEYKCALYTWFMGKIMTNSSLPANYWDIYAKQAVSDTVKYQMTQLS